MQQACRGFDRTQNFFFFKKWRSLFLMHCFLVQPIFVNWKVLLEVTLNTDLRGRGFRCVYSTLACIWGICQARIWPRGSRAILTSRNGAPRMLVRQHAGHSRVPQSEWRGQRLGLFLYDGLLRREEWMVSNGGKRDAQGKRGPISGAWWQGGLIKGHFS